MVATLLVGITTWAQGGGGFQRRTVEERVKAVMDKLVDLKMDKDQTAKTNTVFTDYYKEMDKWREEMRSSGERPDRDAMMAKMQKMNGDRDEKLKKIMTEDQFKKWKDDIEPSMRPQRGGGGGGNRGGN